MLRSVLLYIGIFSVLLASSFALHEVAEKEPRSLQDWLDYNYDAEHFALWGGFNPFIFSVIMSCLPYVFPTSLVGSLEAQTIMTAFTPNLDSVKPVSSALPNLRSFSASSGPNNIVIGIPPNWATSSHPACYTVSRTTSSGDYGFPPLQAYGKDTTTDRFISAFFPFSFDLFESVVSKINQWYIMYSANTGGIRKGYLTGNDCRPVANTPWALKQGCNDKYQSVHNTLEITLTADVGSDTCTGACQQEFQETVFDAIGELTLRAVNVLLGYACSSSVVTQVSYPITVKDYSPPAGGKYTIQVQQTDVFVKGTTQFTEANLLGTTFAVPLRYGDAGGPNSASSYVGFNCRGVALSRDWFLIDLLPGGTWGDSYRKRTDTADLPPPREVKHDRELGVIVSKVTGGCSQCPNANQAKCSSNCIALAIVVNSKTAQMSSPKRPRLLAAGSASPAPSKAPLVQASPTYAPSRTASPTTNSPSLNPTQAPTTARPTTPALSTFTVSFKTQTSVNMIAFLSNGILSSPRAVAEVMKLVSAGLPKQLTRSAKKMTTDGYSTGAGMVVASSEFIKKLASLDGAASDRYRASAELSGQYDTYTANRPKK